MADGGEDRQRTPSVERPATILGAALPVRSCGGRHRLRKRRHAGFTEVKTRESSNYLTEPISWYRSRSNASSSKRPTVYLKERNEERPSRFDIIIIVHNTEYSGSTTSKTRFTRQFDFQRFFGPLAGFRIFAASSSNSCEIQGVSGQDRGERYAARPATIAKEVAARTSGRPGNCASRTPYRGSIFEDDPNKNDRPSFHADGRKRRQRNGRGSAGSLAAARNAPLPASVFRIKWNVPPLHAVVPESRERSSGPRGRSDESRVSVLRRPARSSESRERSSGPRGRTRRFA